MHLRPELVELLYNPLGYYTPWQSCSQSLSTRQRSALNEQLSARFDLPNYSVPSTSQQQLTERLVSAWAVLPAAVYLYALAKHHPALVGSRHFVRLSRPAHCFLRLGFAPLSRQCVAQSLEADALRTWAGDRLQAAVRQVVPDWMEARLRVLLGEPSVEAHGQVDQWDWPCFWSAITYAKGNTTSGAVLGH